MSTGASALRSGEKGEHQNAARAAAVIDALASSGERGLRLTDVVERTGFGTATVHRLLSGLTEHGFIDHDRENNRYFIGLRLLSWAAASTQRYGLAPYVDDSLDALSRETEDTVYFSLRSGNDAVCLDRREGSYPIKTLTLNVGDRRPLGIGSGSMALMAYQEQSFVQRLLEQDDDRRAAMGFPRALIEREIARTREIGFALHEGQLIEGMSGVGVPIRRQDGVAVAAFSVAAISRRLAGERLGEVVALLKNEAVRVEEKAAGILNTPFVRRHSVGRKEQ
jgi:DNA-binding IclR family transcriptional regulator